MRIHYSNDFPVNLVINLVSIALAYFVFAFSDWRYMVYFLIRVMSSELRNTGSNYWHYLCPGILWKGFGPVQWKPVRLSVLWLTRVSMCFSREYVRSWLNLGFHSWVHCGYVHPFLPASFVVHTAPSNFIVRVNIAGINIAGMIINAQLSRHSLILTTCDYSL